MKIILSPAKSLDFEKAPLPVNETIPQLIDKSEYLIQKLQKLSVKKIKELMSISDELAHLNASRYHQWSFPFGSDARQALFVFTGEAYRGLDATSLTEKEVQKAHEKLRILSGLYGIMKPSDLMLPYRLEMGTSFKVTPKTKNLYQFWGDQITEALNAEMEKGELLINVASSEYNKVLNFKKLKAKVITCTFKELKAGEYKVIMTFAKRARGSMARYLIQMNSETEESVKGFNTDGYSYQENLSSESEFVFVR